MHSFFNLAPLILSASVSSVCIFLTFGFTRKIYKSSSEQKNHLLMLFSLAGGLGLFTNHFLMMMFNHPASELFTYPVILPITFICATATIYTVFNAAIRRKLTVIHVFLSSTTASFFILGLSYSALLSMHAQDSIKINFSLQLLGLCLSVLACTGITITMSYINNYIEQHKFAVQFIGALIVAICIVVIYLGFNQSFSNVATVVSPIANSNDSHQYLTSISVALALACIYLITFIVTNVINHNEEGKNNFYFQQLASSHNAQQIDPLTQLPNRQAFEANLEVAIKRSNRAKSAFALAYIDLDHFKPINDQFGHHVGDGVLISIANKLNAAVRGCDFVARIGGDEFVAIIEDIHSKEDIIPIVERIVQAVREEASC